MVEQMVAYHSLFIKMLMGVLFVGLALPFATDKLETLRRYSFIYVMIFHALSSMVAFGGLVAFYVGKFSWSFSLTLMVLVWAAMMFVETKKHLLIKRLQGPQFEANASFYQKSFSKLSLLSLLIVVVMVVLKVLEKKDIIALG